jgi:hypothetical protein
MYSHLIPSISSKKNPPIDPIFVTLGETLVHVGLRNFYGNIVVSFAPLALE